MRSLSYLLLIISHCLSSKLAADQSIDTQLYITARIDAEWKQNSLPSSVEANTSANAKIHCNVGGYAPKIDDGSTYIYSPIEGLTLDVPLMQILNRNSGNQTAILTNTLNFANMHSLLQTFGHPALFSYSAERSNGTPLTGNFRFPSAPQPAIFAHTQQILYFIPGNPLTVNWTAPQPNQDLLAMESITSEVELFNFWRGRGGIVQANGGVSGLILRDPVNGTEEALNIENYRLSTQGSVTLSGLKTGTMGPRELVLSTSAGRSEASFSAGGNWRGDVRMASIDYRTVLDVRPNPITIHRLEAGALANAVKDAGIDEALIPKPDLMSLKGGMVPTKLEGIVADGVTPMLIRVKRPLLSSNTIYTLSISTLDDGSEVTNLSSHLFVRETTAAGPSWQQRPASIFEFPAGLASSDEPVEGDFYACITGIPPEAITKYPTSGPKEVTCRITLRRLDNKDVATFDFKIRKPPVVLIHGYNTEGNWGSSFKNVIAGDRFTSETPEDSFVKELKYGTENDGYKNTNMPLSVLADLVDDLLDGIETQWQAKWAMTRYDVIGHSQGGVLARMLTSKSGVENLIPAFRNNSNSFRGRFNKIITIGSPHNGSTLAAYAFALIEEQFGADAGPEKISQSGLIATYLHKQGTLQKKFDPFGEQIIEINSPNSKWTPDGAAKFHLIATDIPKNCTYHSLIGLWADKPSPPRPSHDQVEVENNQAHHRNLELKYFKAEKLRALVLPNTAYGVGDSGVDMESQMGGVLGWPYASNIRNIAHASVPYLGAVVGGGSLLFGTEDYDVESTEVAERCLKALNGEAPFLCGPFPTAEGPSRRYILKDPSLAQRIREILDIDRFVNPAGDSLIIPKSSNRVARRGDSMNLVYRMTTLEGNEIAGFPEWGLVEFIGDGPKIIDSLLTVDPLDPQSVRVSLPEPLNGDIVLYGRYRNLDGSIVLAKPVRIALSPNRSNFASIKLVASTDKIVVGQKISFDVFGVTPDGVEQMLFLNPDEGTLSAGAPLSITGNYSACGQTVGTTSALFLWEGFSASKEILVNAAPIPSILTQPTGSVIKSGEDYTLRVLAEGGGATLEYQWLRNGVPLTGQKNSELRFRSFSPSDAASYSVIVTSAGGFTESVGAVLTAASSNLEDWRDSLSQTFPLEGSDRIDTDGDGYTNIMEYAFGTDVFKTDTPSVQPLNFSAIAGLTFTTGNRAPEISFDYEKSEDLIHWEKLTGHTFSENFSNKLRNITVIFPSLNGDLSRSFYRVRARVDSTLRQEAYVKAFQTTAGARFGSSVSISGSSMVVGCRAQDDDTGRAYVFVRQDGVWTQQAELIPNFPNSGDTFGTSVAISGDTILVGSPGEQSSSTGVNGPEGNNSAPSSGAAYIFLRTGVTWTQQAYLKASNTGAGDNFGAAVALKNNLAIIGAPGEDSATSAVNGDGSNNAAENSGAAYIYSRHAGVWSQQAYLKASNAESGDSFGGAVALDEKEVAVGASSESSGAKGVNGDQQNNASLNSGAVYLFATENAMWTQKAYVKASNTDENDGFGTSVSLSGQVLAVGAPYEASSSTIINGDQLNNSLPAQGAVYLFRKTAEEWQQETYLKPHSVQGSDTGEIPYGAEFGASVCISGNQILVGAPQERSDSSGLNSSFPNNGAPASGAAYLFVNEDERWALAHFLKASNTESGDNFGWAAAIDGDLSTIGAWSESSGATGINGDQNSNSSAAAGAVYIFASQH